MNKQPLLILAVCFIAGILFQDKISLDKNIICLLVGICLLISISTFLKSYLLHKAKPYLLGLMFFGIGIILHFFNSFSSQNIAVAKNETILFKISRKLNSTEKNKKYEAIAQTGSTIFNIVLYIPKDHDELDFNHYYKSNVFITKPKSPKYDFQFDYAQYLRRKNIEYQCYSNNGVSSVQRNDLSLGEKFSQKRLEVLKKINDAKMSSKTKEFLKGIVLADRTETDTQTLQDFNRSGLVHFLAISGTHIVVVFGLFYFLLVRISPLKFRKYAIVSSLIFIWLFAAFIGFGNSVVRSCIMLSIYYGYVLLQRKPDLLHSLALSAFIILIVDTQQIFDVGFQLSFLAVLGIFWLNEPILKYFPKQDNYSEKLIFNTISISVSAQLATLPLVLYYFHQFSFISIIANFFIVPFSEMIIVFSFLMTVLIAFRFNFSLIDQAYDFIIRLLLKIIHWFADFDSLFFENISMNLVEVFSLFLIVYLMRFIILKFNIKNSSRVLMSVFAFLLLRISFTFYENQKEEILVHEFSKNKILSIKKGDRACFWIHNISDREKIERFIINPYCASRRLNDIEIKFFPKSVRQVVYRGKIYQIN
ncbi:MULTISPECIES: ComEC/Rec2 family competence protein [Chryseobacterium]|uniref:Competence protein ComEC n=1 Tax=Chryseobacterium geocarposphaerae TaxID=1416776 RepID=A0ABU1LGZ0_9FLAO|nr:MULTISPECIES: ComEC/Rec2 family competence protein [Chryseobacterium]MDR6405825.1 competence protein ComEC [Chryseobacterium geocarposphaerae]MDR6699011.1 competence protein ComEC [Chryseobacterium ginsenosidimutans]